MLKRLKEIRDRLNTEDYQVPLEKQFKVHAQNRDIPTLQRLKQIRDRLSE